MAEWSPHWDTGPPGAAREVPAEHADDALPAGDVAGQARFVLVVRHPVAVACATQKWSATRPHELLRHWAVAYGRWPATCRARPRRRRRATRSWWPTPTPRCARALAVVGLDDHAPGRTVGDRHQRRQLRRRPHHPRRTSTRVLPQLAGAQAALRERVYIDLAERRYEGAGARLGVQHLRARSQVPAADPRWRGWYDEPSREWAAGSRRCRPVRGLRLRAGCGPAGRVLARADLPARRRRGRRSAPWS